MMNTMRNCSLLLIAAILLGVPARVSALSMVEANLAQMVKFAETAFAGTVTEVEVIETAMGWGERITVEVTEPIYGVEDGEMVSWIQARSGEETRFPGMPEYAVGEEHCVFLAAAAPGSVYQAPIALGQGSFRCYREKDSGELLVRNGFQNAALFKNVDTTALRELTVTREKTERAQAKAEGKPVEETPIESPDLSIDDAGAIGFSALARVARTMKSVADPVELFVEEESGELTETLTVE